MSDTSTGVNSVKTLLDSAVRTKLREAVAAYGAAAFADPRRFEAILRDLCPESSKEVFLLVSALRERVAPELLSDPAGSRSAVTARLAARLSEHLGLSESASIWAVESWHFALDDNPGLTHPSSPLPPIRDAAAPWTAIDEPGPYNQTRQSVEWPWLVMCLVAIVASIVALVSTTWMAFDHLWESWAGGLLECVALAFLLAVTAGAEILAARSFIQMDPPRHKGLDPRHVPFALLPEVFVILLLPLVPLVVPVAWLAEWWGELHFAGPAHELRFHVIRSVEAVMIAAFVYVWIPAMTTIQGRIAASLVRNR